MQASSKFDSRKVCCVFFLSTPHSRKMAEGGRTADAGVLAGGAIGAVGGVDPLGPGGAAPGLMAQQSQIPQAVPTATVHGIPQGLFDTIGSLQEACAAVGLIDGPLSLTMRGIVNLLGENPQLNVPLTVVADLTDTEFDKCCSTV